MEKNYSLLLTEKEIDLIKSSLNSHLETVAFVPTLWGKKYALKIDGDSQYYMQISDNGKMVPCRHSITMDAALEQLTEYIDDIEMELGMLK